MAISILPASTAIDEPDHHEHPSDAKYIQIAIFLAVVTVIEVAIYYLESVEALLVPALVVLSAIKFGTVIGYFMHLKFDDRRLLWIFSFGLIIALGIYLGTWATMHYLPITTYIADMF